jgi:hypothetical protein
MTTPEEAARRILELRDKPEDWAAEAARRILENQGDTAAIETANYQECSFIIRAAELVLRDRELAERIGRMMEPRRSGIM